MIARAWSAAHPRGALTRRHRRGSPANSLQQLAVAMLSGILIFNQKGENLIFRAFRNDCRPRLADVFRIQVISNAQVRSPILTLGSTTFSHVKHENIYLVAVTKSNANAALVFEFLYRFVGLGKAYFGKFDEEAVKNNFVLVYELLDEILDFGYPQNTETDTLKMYITTEGVKSERAMVGCLLIRSRMIADGHIGGFLEDYNASDGRSIMAASRHQIPQKRGLCRRDRGREPAHVSDRDSTAGRRQRANHNAGISIRNTRVQIRAQRPADAR
jgi:hypothetical protein